MRPRIEWKELAGSDEAVSGEPTASDPPVVERCPEGRDLHGMGLDVAQGFLVDFSSLVFAAPAGDLPGVVGCQIEIVYAAPASDSPVVVGGGCNDRVRRRRYLAVRRPKPIQIKR